MEATEKKQNSNEPNSKGRKSCEEKEYHSIRWYNEGNELSLRAREGSPKEKIGAERLRELERRERTRENM